VDERVIEALGAGIAARVAVLLWGGPGVGKTTAVQRLAEAADLPCELVISSIREPSDFSGLPVVGPHGRSVHLVPPARATRLADAGRGVLFFDEISSAAPAVQAALMRIVLERSVGDLPLPDGVAIVAAANPPEQAADGWDLAAPLANRFCHLTWPLECSGMADGCARWLPDRSCPRARRGPPRAGHPAGVG
jgi:MoxR-like ATPase